MGLRTAAVGAGALLLVLAGCSSAEETVSDAASRAREQVEQLTDRVVSETIGAKIRDELAKVGVDLQGAPSCDPSVDLSKVGEGVSGSVTCTGTSTKGEEVKATFSGQFKGTSCSGSLVITVAGKERVNKPEVQACG